MGKFLNGILGGFSGKIGAVVGSNWKGIEYMRGRSRRRRPGSGTAEQIVHRAKFSLVAKFLTAMRSVITFGFKNLAVNQTEYNAALAQTLDAVAGVYPELSIDYSKVLVTSGRLEEAEAPVVASTAPGTIDFSWTDNSEIGDNVLADDNAVLIAYCESMNRGKYTAAGATRNAGAAILPVNSFSGKEVHTWIAFASKDGKQVSPSIYCGKVLVQ